MIIHALEKKNLPVYGDGSNVRGWLHVSDHCEFLTTLIDRGRISETHNIGGGNERANRDVFGNICDAPDRAFAADPDPAARFPYCPAAAGSFCHSLLTLIDRPGSDRRYGIDAAKLAQGLGSRTHFGFESGLDQTAQGYLDHEPWWREVSGGAYQNSIDLNCSFRIAV